jgi:hypothetical protein
MSKLIRFYAVGLTAAVLLALMMGYNVEREQLTGVSRDCLADEVEKTYVLLEQCAVVNRLPMELRGQSLRACPGVQCEPAPDSGR